MKTNRIRRRRFISLLALAAPFVVAADGFGLEPRWLATRRLKLCDGTPKLRLVHFTDIHHKGNKALLESVVKRINALSPDLVCFTGDIVEEAKHLPEALQILSGIKSPVYGIPGNHDYWSNADFAPTAKCFEATGGGWMENGSLDAAGGKVHLIGWARGTTQNQPSRPGAKNILLMHYPAWIEGLNGSKYDLVLAGHSHGGQVRLPFFGPLIVPFDTGKYSLGLFRTASGPFYVSSGIGWFYLNVRFNCRPEIMVIEL